jgi:hypothetical protein
MWLAITAIEAKEMINSIIVSGFPNQEVSKRRELMRSLEKQSKLVSSVKKDQNINNEDLDKWLRSALGG